MTTAYGKILVRLVCVLMCGLFKVQANALGGPQYVTNKECGGESCVAGAGEGYPAVCGRG
jgi:hypothetical protein